MNQLTEAELQTLAGLDPQEFYQALMQIVAGGLTDWRNESSRRHRARRALPPLQPAVSSVVSNTAETVESLVSS